MTPAEAKAALLRHAGWEENHGDGLLAWLRPYRGLNDDHFLEILHALYVLQLDWADRPEVDRRAVGAIMDICLTGRNWTEDRYDDKIRRKDFISAADKAKLDDWLFVFEHYAVRLLHGLEPYQAHLGPDWHVLHRYGLAGRAPFAAPPLVRRLSEYSEDGEGDYAEDDEVPLCEMLGAVGPAARDAGAEPVLARLAARSRFPAVRDAATAALATVRPG
ncbi:MAG: hypothetical protein K2X82_19845 [Gemmataceae bacterium]|nr:hypothetical protein [Gemmataceae bacterium]